LPSPLALSRAGSTMNYINYENQEVVGTSTQVPRTNWLCIMEVPLGLMFADLGRLRTLSGVVDGAFALLLVVVVWLVVRSIVLPLKRLVDGAERIREGSSGVTVDMERSDELGQLSQAFNQMSVEVERSAHKIRNLHEQEMRRAAQLATVGELASGIAHEIKNPMAGISSGLDLLEKDLGEDHRADDLMRQMKAQLRRMESAVGDLLRFARPKEPQLLRVDPADVVDRALGLVRSQAEAATVSIDYSRQAVRAAIMVDPEQLTQAIVNLALNAIQAMEDGGRLAVAIDNQKGNVRIDITDTGTGIEEGRIEEIFRPYVTTKHRGTGLGLAITRAIVERNGGRIEVDSEPGVGSCFTLLLPAVAEKERLSL
ncbi:MAG: ATP-binding protein, partial [Gemmatimonadales bacterium]